MIRKIFGRAGALCGTLAFSLAGFFLRKQQLAVGFDEAGLPNGTGVWPLVILSAAAVALFVAVALLKEKRPGYEENFSAALPAVVLAAAGAGLLLAGNVLAFRQAGVMFPAAKLLPVLGAAAAFSFVAVAAGWYREKQPAPVLSILPVAYYILQLILNFKSWSTDPIILDYCFKLFALICVLLATFHIGSFVFGAGQRRVCLAFCLTGVFFSAVSLADGGLVQMLQTAGSALWLLAGSWQLLKE